jgi:tRNA-dihydrouridine synthase B
MIGRGAQGRPWIFAQINNYILQKVLLPMPSIDSQRDIIRSHLDAIYNFYGEKIGVRVAKKHLSWYCEYLPGAEDFRSRFVRTNNSSKQMQLTNNFFHRCLN